MKVYVDASFKNFSFLEQEEPIYVGENQTSSICVYFKRDLKELEYPTLSFILPNGREVGTLTMIRKKSDNDDYEIMYKYKFSKTDLLLPGIMHCTLNINKRVEYASEEIKEINSVGTFDCKVMKVASTGDYDIIGKENTEDGEVITSFKSELDSVRNTVNDLRNGVTVNSISQSELLKMLD